MGVAFITAWNFLKADPVQEYKDTLDQFAPSIPQDKAKPLPKVGVKESTPVPPEPHTDPTEPVLYDHE